MRDEQQSAHLQQLTAKLRDRTAVIGIIGLGYRVLKCPFRSAAGSSAAALRVGRGSTGMLRIDGLCDAWAIGRWSVGLVMGCLRCSRTVGDADRGGERTRE